MAVSMKFYRVNQRTRKTHALVEGAPPEVSVVVQPNGSAVVRVVVPTATDNYTLILSIAEAAALGANLTAIVQPYNPPEAIPLVRVPELDVITMAIEVYKSRGIVAADLYVAHVLQCDRIDAIRLVREVLQAEGIKLP